MLGSLRRLLWTIAALGCAGALAAALIYLKLTSSLPQMETPGEVIALMARSVDGIRERRSHESGVTPTPFAVVPRELLASPAGMAMLVLQDCPDYLAAPAVGPIDFWLEVASPKGEGSAHCAVDMASDLAARLLLASRNEQLVAADHLRGLLGRDDLLALWLSTLQFEPDGPQGVATAARALFGKDAQSLGWEEAGETVVATQLYDQVAYCKNPPYLRHLRDRFFDRAAALIPANAAALHAAAAEPMDCETRHRVAGAPRR